jgi:hypothetical protein
VVGCTIGSREELPGERKPVIKMMMMVVVVVVMVIGG